MKSSLLLPSVAVLLAFAFQHPASAQEAGSALKPQDRILFIGDSITGNGVNHGAEAWANLMKSRLATAYPEAGITTTSLGGSGMTIGAWKGTFNRELKEEQTLDVKEVRLKENLEKPADVVVIMLGMNDILSPSGPPTEAWYDQWEADYRSVVASLRDRVKPRVVAIATPTLCTEDPAAPKNEQMRKLHERIQKIAETDNCLVLPTYANMEKVRNEGLRYRPGFRATADGVHPNRFGHYAIAAGMLEGLGEKKISETLLDEVRALSVGKEPAPISWLIRRNSAPSDLQTATDRFTLTYHTPESEKALNRGPAPALKLPEGWKILSQKHDALSGEFEVEGPLDRLRNHFTLSANGREASLFIPAPWLIGYTKADRIPGKGWVAGNFKMEDSVLPVDSSLLSGEKLGEPVEVYPGISLTWNRYIANPFLSTKYDEGSIDFDALFFYTHFSVGYGARWIYSEKERSVKFGVEKLGFAGSNTIRLDLNGKTIFQGPAGPRGTETEAVSLKEGWNLVSFKTNHGTWQWKFALDLRSAEGEEALDNLKVSVTKPNE